jgi:hypothetical protein
VLERLGFTGVAATAFPEEMLRFDGLDDLDVMAGDKEKEQEKEKETLPQTWQEKGLELPMPPADLEDAKRIVFAAVTGRDIESWEDVLKVRRGRLGLPGLADRPFQWSIQDLYCIASVTLANVVFVRLTPSGLLRVDRWIAPPATGPKVANPVYMIFWGPRQLLLSRGKLYRFLARDLPGEFLTALDGASPIPEEEARGSVDSLDLMIVGAEAGEAKEEVEGAEAGADEAKEGGEGPALVIAEEAKEANA